MELIRSVCTNMAFPGSRENLDEFRRAAEFLAGYGIRNLEFYHDSPNADRFGEVLRDNGMTGIFIGVIPSKEAKLNLCDPEGWEAAAKYYAALMDVAQANGVETLMYNSGFLKKGTEEAQMEALGKAIEYIHNDAARKNYRIHLVLEPGDSNMSSFQLLGPYQRVLEHCQRMEKAGTPVYLTMDAAHSAEEGEDFTEAVKAVRNYCNHIHFANCFIKDPTHELYGDKHVGFDYPDTEWTPETLRVLWDDLKPLYADDKLILAMEYLCREADPYAYFDKLYKGLDFLP